MTILFVCSKSHNLHSLTSSQGVPILTNARNNLATNPSKRRKIFATPSARFNMLNKIQAIPFNIANNIMPNPAKNLLNICIPSYSSIPSKDCSIQPVAKSDTTTSSLTFGLSSTGTVILSESIITLPETAVPRSLITSLLVSQQIIIPTYCNFTAD